MTDQKQNQPQSQPKQSLREKVQSFRDQAKNILRMEKINALLRYKLTNSKRNEMNEEILKQSEKDLKKVVYKISRLDEADPEFKSKSEKAEETKKQIEKNITTQNKRIEEVSKEMEKKEKEYNEKIEKWESGERSVSIEDVCVLTAKMIFKV